MIKNIVLLGSTGSIGRNVLAVLRENQDHFRLIGMAAGSKYMGLVLIVITALIGFFSLRRKPAPNKPAKTVVDVVAEAPVSPVTPEAPVAPEAAETRRITGEDRLPPTS